MIFKGDLQSRFQRLVHFPVVYFVRRSSMCSQNSEFLKLWHGSANKRGPQAIDRPTCRDFERGHCCCYKRYSHETCSLVLGISCTFGSYILLEDRACVAETAKFWNCAMARRTNMEFWHEIIDNLGDDDSVSEGFSGDNFIKVDGDLDINFEALPSDNTSDSEASDEDGDTSLILSTKSRTRSARHSRSRHHWRFDPIHKLPVDSKPAYNFGLFFFATKRSKWWPILKLQILKNNCGIQTVWCRTWLFTLDFFFL